MGGKRERSESELETETGFSNRKKHKMKGEGEEKEKEKKEILPSMIKNKEKRSVVHAKIKLQKKLEKRKRAKARDAAEKRALELGEEPPPRSVPRTIENTREVDETVCKPDDEELFAGNDADEFGEILKRDRIPKVLITTCRYHSSRGPAFISELLSVIPNAHFYKRGTYDLKKIVEYANKKDFSSIIVVHTNRREPDALLIIGLPEGPTAHFKLSNLVLRKDIKNHGNPTTHKPELVLNNFTTRLGHRMGRYIFESKESKQTDSKGKEAKGEKASQERMVARLQECGPRFTLKLISLQHGTFDSKGGEFEWVHKPEMDTSRRSRIVEGQSRNELVGGLQGQCLIRWPFASVKRIAVRETGLDSNKILFDPLRQVCPLLDISITIMTSIIKYEAVVKRNTRMSTVV
uniref:Brix domain-containing protein n=1 Tax=Fagus sylvatica TaxID=28930 RepID=A0A2N9FM35_FAGSY